jgi:ABC-type proline/glycine betaine transport system substrate-binding protein
MKHTLAGAALAALGLLALPGSGVLAADITFLSVGGPPSVAKAHTFKAILEALDSEHTARVSMVDADSLLGSLSVDAPQVTFDLPPDALRGVDLEAQGLIDLGPNQMGALPQRQTVVTRALAEEAPEVAEFLNLFFVSETRLNDMGSLVGEDDAIDQADLAAWVEDNEPWVRNMLALCPQFSAGACDTSNESTQPFQARDWYGTPAADR